MRKHYINKIKHFNRPLPLAPYLVPLVGEKKEIKLIDLGSGPYPITGQLLDGVKIETVHIDQQDFTNWWKDYKTTPLYPILVQDMENLPYEDGTFDIAHSMNALDHTKNAEKALQEMIRVTKPGGWVYIDCALIQHTNRGHRHFWDALEDGTFRNDPDAFIWPDGRRHLGDHIFDLKEYGFSIEFVDNGGERQFNHIICKKQC